MIEPDPEAAIAYGLFSVGQAKAAGFDEAEIRRRVRRGRWEQVSRGVLQDCGRSPRSGDRYVREVLESGRRAVAGFSAAASVFGWDMGRIPDTPTVILPPGTVGRGPVTAYRTVLPPQEVLLMGVLRLTTPLRTALDLACFLPLLAAVVMLDSVLRSRQVTRHDLAAGMSGFRGRGVPRARQALALADPASGSIAESLARLLFHQAGLAPPISQYLLRLGDSFARVDFAWPQYMLIVEIDGREWHVEAGVFRQDRVRQNAWMQDGWLVLRFTAEQVRLEPEYVLAEVRRAMGR